MRYRDWYPSLSDYDGDDLDPLEWQVGGWSEGFPTKGGSKTVLPVLGGSACGTCGVTMDRCEWQTECRAWFEGGKVGPEPGPHPRVTRRW